MEHKKIEIIIKAHKILRQQNHDSWNLTRNPTLRQMLRDMGFDCGQNVTVRHEKNKIIITVDNNGRETDE